MDPYFPSQPAAEAHARKDTYLTNNWPMCIYLNILPAKQINRTPYLHGIRGRKHDLPNLRLAPHELIQA